MAVPIQLVYTLILTNVLMHRGDILPVTTTTTSPTTTTTLANVTTTTHAATTTPAAFLNGMKLKNLDYWMSQNGIADAGTGWDIIQGTSELMGLGAMTKCGIVIAVVPCTIQFMSMVEGASVTMVLNDALGAPIEQTKEISFDFVASPTETCAQGQCAVVCVNSPHWIGDVFAVQVMKMLPQVFENPESDFELGPGVLVGQMQYMQMTAHKLTFPIGAVSISSPRYMMNGYLFLKVHNMKKGVYKVTVEPLSIPKVKFYTIEADGTHDFIWEWGNYTVPYAEKEKAIAYIEMMHYGGDDTLNGVLLQYPATESARYFYINGAMA